MLKWAGTQVRERAPVLSTRRSASGTLPLVQSDIHVRFMEVSLRGRGVHCCPPLAWCVSKCGVVWRGETHCCQMRAAQPTPRVGGNALVVRCRVGDGGGVGA
jgi:hypothetical protein